MTAEGERARERSLGGEYSQAVGSMRRQPDSVYVVARERERERERSQSVVVCLSPLG